MPYKDKARQKRYQRQWYAGRRAAYLADHPCVICGSTEHLEVHHRVQAEKVSHRIWSWTAARRAVELAKCDVLCSTHHACETYWQRHQAA